MLTLDMLFAVLQGLPADHLDYLDRPWYLLAVRIERVLKDGLDPYAALHAALSNSNERERRVYLRAYTQEEPVLALPDLTQRQKEALVALRYAGACSLSQLSRILAQDRGNTSRRLDVLIEKGYAVKYFRRDGPYYLSISAPLRAETRSQVIDLIQAFKEALFAHDDDSAAKQSPANVDVPSSAEPSKNSNASASFARASSARASSAHATTPTTSTKATSPTTPTKATSASGVTKPTTASRLPRPP